MRIATFAAGALIVLLLSGCAPDTPQPNPPGEEQPLPDAEPTPPAIPLPADAVMLVTATATASTGAVLELRATVHEPQAANDAAGTPVLAAWCEGEIDAGILSDQKYSVVEIEYSATASTTTASNTTTTWPSAETIWLHPTPDYNALAHDGSVQQVEYPLDTTEPGAYVPRCLQYALLDGAGTGSTYAAIETDAAGREGVAPLRFWASLTYGFTNALVSDSASVTFSHCTTTITDLGATFGAPGPGWHEDFLPKSCVVGGTTGN